MKLEESFHHYEWSIKNEDNRCVGILAAGESIKPYQKPLKAFLNYNKFSAAELREIADLLDNENREYGHESHTETRQS